MYQSFIKQHQLSDDFLDLAKTHFAPLAEEIILKQKNVEQQKQAKAPFLSV
jgi:hypothetical protein